MYILYIYRHSYNVISIVIFMFTSTFLSNHQKLVPGVFFLTRGRHAHDESELKELPEAFTDEMEESRPKKKSWDACSKLEIDWEPRSLAKKHPRKRSRNSMV